HASVADADPRIGGAGPAHAADHPPEPGLGDRLQRAGPAAGRDGNGDAVAGRAGDGGLVPDRDPERPAPVLAQAAAPGTGGCDHRACPHHRELTMAILLFLIPISLLLLGVAVWAFVWSVRGGQYD